MATRLLLSLLASPHYTEGHNRGHHIDVATPVDGSSARVGETAYAYTVRKISGLASVAKRVETERLALNGHNWMHPDNRLLQGYALFAAIIAGFAIAFGGMVALGILVYVLATWLILGLVSYQQHYGLLRRRDEQGRYERTTAAHSWDADWPMSTVMQLHNQRHAHHHTRPSLGFADLEVQNGSARLPFGYAVSMIAATCPPLWERTILPILFAHLAKGGAALHATERGKRIFARYAQTNEQ